MVLPIMRNSRREAGHTLLYRAVSVASSLPPAWMSALLLRVCCAFRVLTRSGALVCKHKLPYFGVPFRQHACTLKKAKTSRNRYFVFRLRSVSCTTCAKLSAEAFSGLYSEQSAAFGVSPLCCDSTITGRCDLREVTSPSSSSTSPARTGALHFGAWMVAKSFTGQVTVLLRPFHRCQTQTLCPPARWEVCVARSGKGLVAGYSFCA